MILRFQIVFVILLLTKVVFANDYFDSYDGKLVSSVFQFTANSATGYQLSCKDDKTEILTPNGQSIALTEFDCKDLQGLLLIADKNNVVRLEVKEGRLLSKEPLFDVDAQRIKAKNKKVTK